MALSNPFTITYGTRSVGGSDSTYLLDGVYSLERDAYSFRIVFRVTVTSSSTAGLKSAAETVEDEFSKRDQDLTIDLSGSTFTYVNGTDFLNSRATVSKPGDETTDRGYSRSYLVTVEADMPLADQGGLQDVSIQVDAEPGGQKTVTMQGAYTASGGANAYSRYVSDFGTGGSGQSSDLLSFVDSSATFELVDHTWSLDRNTASSSFPHVVQFTQQYLELLYQQSAGTLDSTSIADHTVTYSNLIQHSGDAREGIQGFRRVVATFDGAAVVAQTTNLQNLYSDTIRPFIKTEFTGTYNPRVFAIEDERQSFDETTKRLSCQVQFIYAPNEGSEVLSVTQSVAFEETRIPEKTHVHSGGEFDAYVDPGWATLRRISTRTVEVLGEEEPRRRIGVRPSAGIAGDFETVEAGAEVVNDGWTVEKNMSSVAPSFKGNPGDEQIRTTVLNETVIETWSQTPRSGTIGGGGGGGPITGNRGGSFGRRFD